MTGLAKRLSMIIVIAGGLLVGTTTQANAISPDYFSNGFVCGASYWDANAATDGEYGVVFRENVILSFNNTSYDGYNTYYYYNRNRVQYSEGAFSQYDTWVCSLRFPS